MSGKQSYNPCIMFINTYKLSDCNGIQTPGSLHDIHYQNFSKTIGLVGYRFIAPGQAPGGGGKAPASHYSHRPPSELDVTFLKSRPL